MSGSGEYFAHASRLNDRAKKAHDEWIGSLTPAQRDNLKRLGVLDAADDSSEVGGHAPTQLADIADSPMARIDPDIAAGIDTQADLLAEEFDIPIAKARKILAWQQVTQATALRAHEADLLSIIVGGLLAAKNIRIASAGLAFASNMAAANGLGSQAEYARSIGVSRTIISKAVKGWQRQLNLHTSPFQKSEEACATYSAVAKDKHWRSQKVSAVGLAQRIHALLRKKS